MYIKSDSLMKAYDNCNLVFQGEKKPSFSLMYKNVVFISEIIGNENSSRGLVLHAGSETVFLITTVLSAYSCLLKESFSNIDLINNLNKGDMVIYNKSRGVFSGFDDQGRAIIKQSKSLNNYVPQALFYKITPYHGKATKLDGRGVRDIFSVRREFISDVFEIEIYNIPNIIDFSIVVVCNKHDADIIMNETEIEFGSGKRIFLHDAFTAAYYTASDIHHYAGNSAKTNPVLKFTSKISVARELILEDEDRKIVGMVVNGREVIDGGLSELTSLLSRRSLKSITLLDRIDSGEYQQLLEQFPDLKLFAWTKEAVLSQIKEPIETSSAGNKSNKIYHYLNNIMNKNITFLKQDSDIDFELYSTIKKSLLKIARNDFISEEKDYFIMNGFSLLNLFTFACFPLNIFEKQVDIKKIGITLPAAKIDKMKVIADEFSGTITNEMILVVRGLLEFYKTIYNENPKYESIIKKMNSSFGKEKIAIVTPKAYFYDIFLAVLTEENKTLPAGWDFVTVNKFNNDKLYHEIIVTGVFLGKNFGIFNSNSSANINVLAYPFESYAFNKLKSSNEKLFALYNDRNSLKYEWESDIKDEGLGDGSENILFEIDHKLDEYINSVAINNVISKFHGSDNEGQATTKITRVATFETEETVFFTKHYCPLVFNSGKGIVIESEVGNLVPGDVLIFTNHNDEARDIVEKILNDLIKSNRSDAKLKESYRKYRYWKDTLKQYMNNNQLSYSAISKEMHKIGHKKHEVTLRTWLDEDSHIVGPRDAESFYAIALITNDREMLNKPEAFCEACQVIRSMRTRILRFIGVNIINSICGGSMYETDDLLQSVVANISEMALTLQINNIVDAEELYLPSYLANRPQYL